MAYLAVQDHMPCNCVLAVPIMYLQYETKKD